MDRGRARKPISGGNLNRALKVLLKRADLPQSFRFHDLRHTCATLLLRQGVNPKFVQEIRGHADISLTLNVYSHVLPDMGTRLPERWTQRLVSSVVSEWCQKVPIRRRGFLIFPYFAG